MFAGARVPGPFEHTWSLAIEEQFYLVWPVLVWLVCRRAGRRAVLGLAVALLFITAYLQVLLSFAGASTERLYVGTDTRAPAFLVGACCVLAFDHAGKFARWATWVVPAGLVVLAVACLTMDGNSQITYRGPLPRGERRRRRRRARRGPPRAGLRAGDGAVLATTPPPRALELRHLPVPLADRRADPRLGVGLGAVRGRADRRDGARRGELRTGRAPDPRQRHPPPTARARARRGGRGDRRRRGGGAGGASLGERRRQGRAAGGAADALGARPAAGPRPTQVRRPALRRPSQRRRCPRRRRPSPPPPSPASRHRRRTAAIHRARQHHTPPRLRTPVEQSDPSAQTGGGVPIAATDRERDRRAARHQSPADHRRLRALRDPPATRRRWPVARRARRRARRTRLHAERAGDRPAAQRHPRAAARSCAPGSPPTSTRSDPTPSSCTTG